MSPFMVECVSRDVLGDPDVKHALHAFVEQLNYRIDVEHFGGESSTARLVEREQVLRDEIVEAVLGLEVGRLP